MAIFGAAGVAAVVEGNAVLGRRTSMHAGARHAVLIAFAIRCALCQTILLRASTQHTVVGQTNVAPWNMDVKTHTQECVPQIGKVRVVRVLTLNCKRTVVPQGAALGYIGGGRRSGCIGGGRRSCESLFGLVMDIASHTSNIWAPD